MDLDGWKLRDDVLDGLTESLPEEQLWTVDPDYPDIACMRNGARWQVVGDDGSSALIVLPIGKHPGYSVPFAPEVAAPVIIAACVQAAADCYLCGTSCEGDCQEPDGVVFGRDGDGTVYSEMR